MNKKSLALLVLLFLIGGCATTQGEKEKTGIAPPLITQSFAAKQISPGENWEVYLNASDPDGDMKDIVCSIGQPGMGESSPSFTRIAKENAKELSGTIYLSTLNVASLNSSRLFTNLTLTVQIRDQQGHFSQPVVFPLSFVSSPKKETPPAGVFKEKDLGPIMISLF